MLSPAGEAWHRERDLLRLGLESLALWPGYAARLGVQAVDYRDAGTVLAAGDRSDLDVLTGTLALLEEHGVPVALLDRKELRRAEPTLSRRVCGGALLRGDHSVNPRRVVDALLARVGGRLLREAARPCDGGVVTASGTTYRSDVVVVATGHRVDPGVPEQGLVRPVRGEIVRARSDDPPVRTVRAIVRGQPVYVVPREGGEVVVGATSEEHDGEAVPTVGGVSRLLDAARALLPGLDRAEVLEVLARNRPGTPDNGPLIGPSAAPGLLLACGHHRGGVLLAPVTARAVRAYVEGAPVDGAAASFLPTRLTRRTA
jgi:glycine oxidase